MAARRLLASLLIAGACAGAFAGEARPLPAPADLKESGRIAASRGQPVVILFSLPDCSYCEEVRNNYLAPLLREGAEAQRPVILEVDIIGRARLSGFGGEQLSQSDLARAYRIRVAPTVAFFDGSGAQLVPPLVGGDTTGLYGGYLDNALSTAARKMRMAPSSTTPSGKRP